MGFARRASVGSRNQIDGDPLHQTSANQAIIIDNPEIEQAVRRLRAKSQNAALIQKPPGEVNRSGRRGYNLQQELDWGKSEYKDVKVIHGIKSC